MREARAAGRAPRATVLVADDDAAKRYVAARWLQQAGYAVVEAESGGEALQRARDLPDLIVLDVRLPDISGFEVCRRIKAHPRTGHIPVLHLTAHAGSTQERVAGLDGGADAYLSQPIEPAELTATVRALLRIRETESALRASEERYRLVARATNDVIWDWDLATGEVVWNQAAASLFGLPPAEIAPSAEWWAARIHPADRARVVGGLRAVTGGRGAHWADEYRLLRGDGGYATVFDRGFVAHDEQGAPVRMIGSMLDVTERKLAEEGQQFLAEAAAVLAASLDYETTLGSVARLAVPRLADCVLVYAADADGGGRLLEAGAAYPMLAAEARRRAPATIAVGDGSPGRATCLLRGDAPTLHADLAARLDDPLGAALAASGMRCAVVARLVAHERTLGVLVLARGGTAAHYDASDLALARAFAERAALAADNGRLYESAVVANRAKDDFLAVMSHELRTPLNAVVGYSDLLLLGMGGSLTPEGEAYVGRTLSCAKHLLQLIEQILTYSRMEAGREQIVLEPADAVPLARDAALLIEPLAADKGLSFEFAADAAPLAVRTDVGKVRQILLNLLSNAVKFTDRGTVRLRVSREPGHSGLARFDVVDTGIGIRPEHLQQVFDPFWQVQQQKTRTAGGSGLGLTVSRRLARLLGGDLTIESRYGAGSTFTLRLPVG